MRECVEVAVCRFKRSAETARKIALVNALGKAHAQHDVFLALLVRVKDVAIHAKRVEVACGNRLDIRFRVGGRCVAYTCKIGVRGRAETEVFLAQPVAQIVSGSRPVACVIADLLARKAVLLEQRRHKLRHVCLRVLVGKGQLVAVFVKGCAFLNT